MTRVELVDVKRLRGGSPVLYRREYRAELVVDSGREKQKFPLDFTLERNPLGGWKVHLGELDKACQVGQDRLISLIGEMESGRKLP